MEGSGFSYYPGSCPERLRINSNNRCLNTGSPTRGLKAGPPKYEAVVEPVRPRSCVCVCVFVERPVGLYEPCRRMVITLLCYFGITVVQLRFVKKCFRPATHQLVVPLPAEPHPFMA